MKLIFTSKVIIAHSLLLMDYIMGFCIKIGSLHKLEA